VNPSVLRSIGTGAQHVGTAAAILPGAVRDVQGAAHQTRRSIGELYHAAHNAPRMRMEE